ncbi:hypothetical protein TNCV_4125841 [Trichonephila clavipes]|nr:hypothetical protein TNCV_4125841 [Trichonephila clavipes]
MYPMKKNVDSTGCHLFAGNIVEIVVPASTQAGIFDDGFQPLHWRNEVEEFNLYTELSGQNINLDFQVLYIGAMGTEKPPTSLTSASSNKENTKFCRPYAAFHLQWSTFLRYG